MSLHTQLMRVVQRIASEVATRESITKKGKPLGYASLDENGKIPQEQIDHTPSKAPFVITVLDSKEHLVNESFTLAIVVHNFQTNDEIVLLSNDGLIQINSQQYNPDTKVVTVNCTASDHYGEYIVGVKRGFDTTASTVHVTIVDDPWIDLRSGGTPVPNLEVKSKVNINRSSKGLSFSGESLGWDDYALFNDVQWRRSENKTLSMIMYLDQTKKNIWPMFGIGSLYVRKSSSTQYWQGEQLLYMSQSDGSDFYGGGPHTDWTDSAEFTIPESGYYKFEWLHNGETVNIYKVSSTKGSWSGGELIATVKVSPTNPNPASYEFLVLMAVPAYNTTAMKITAYKVE